MVWRMIRHIKDFTTSIKYVASNNVFYGPSWWLGQGLRFFFLKLNDPWILLKWFCSRESITSNTPLHSSLDSNKCNNRVIRSSYGRYTIIIPKYIYAPLQKSFYPCHFFLMKLNSFLATYCKSSSNCYVFFTLPS